QNTPTITANLISTNGGASVVGGNFICNNQCDSSTIRVTISNIRWNQSPNSEWLHGIFLPANAGFMVSPVALPAGFITYNTGCVGQCPSGSGTNGGPGFYFDNTAGQSCCNNVTANDGYPCNNYGNVGITCGNSFSMSFDIKFCNSLVTTTNYTFVFRGTSDGETGCWNIDDAAQHQIQFTIPTTACAPSNLAPTATVPSRSCINNVVNYTSTLTANCNQFSVHWWDAAVGGNLVGTGSPFVYDPSGSTCPAGTTLYATCCNSAIAGCVAREAIIIPGGCDSLNLTNVTTTAPPCFGQGAINSITVANASGAVSYTLQPGNITNTSGVFTGLGLNQYTVSVSDGSSCSITSLVTFTQPQPMVMNAPVLGG
nr:hypothetical protein [Chitinophagaceae bacterium]